jgi:hypothetical protein
MIRRRDRPVIEIMLTPEMVEAGMGVLLAYDSRFETEESALMRAFIAMITKADIEARVTVANSLLPRLGEVLPTV